jgi:photosystem II stability/assembly factor-like uncharacterized protein
MLRVLSLALLLAASLAPAQWQIVTPAPTTADLRGIDSDGKGNACASGTNGTILRTLDSGKSWTRCATPPDADHLDFRAVQAFDASTAIVMSIGKGPLSRLYKTTDACQTWKLTATNPDLEGFWDSMKADPAQTSAGKSGEMVFVLGDSVGNKLQVWEWKEGWEERELEHSYEAMGNTEAGEGSFAASNSVFQVVTTAQIDNTWKYHLRWVSGNAQHSYMAIVRDEQTNTCEPCRQEHLKVPVPMAQGSLTAGVFSFAFRSDLIGIAVGGDYTKPESQVRTAASSLDGGLTWKLSTSMPHGFRSAVAYDDATKTWITVGPNGTDTSTDDGRNWRALLPDPKFNDPADSDQHWNALSLPYVVGPGGRIGILRSSALSNPPKSR